MSLRGKPTISACPSGSYSQIFCRNHHPISLFRWLSDVWTDIFWEMMLNFLEQNRLNTSWFKLEIKRKSSCRHHPHQRCISGHVPLGWVLLPGSHTEWHGPWWILSYMKAQESLLFQKDLCYWPVNCLNSLLGMHSFGLKSCLLVFKYLFCSAWVWETAFFLKPAWAQWAHRMNTPMGKGRRPWKGWQ